MKGLGLQPSDRHLKPFSENGTSAVHPWLNKIITGDCMGLMPQIPDDFAEMTLTDIPYNIYKIKFKPNNIRKVDKEDANDRTFHLPPFLSEVVRITKGSIYIFCGIEQISSITRFLDKKDLMTRLCCLEKDNPSPMNGQYTWLSGIEACVFARKSKAVFNEHCKNTIWRFPSGDAKRHPTEKPLALFRYLVKVSSNPGQVVFDPCLGSGTTAVAARKQQRNFIGFEINPEYADIARGRVAALP